MNHFAVEERTAFYLDDGVWYRLGPSHSVGGV